ncbi:MAG: tRNA pseudouridine(38-40) synthase TruA [Acidobacteria bacterium]|nr:tRNA pseudouridine(38-40) synthase TruA [Acidobacteriota bacterium]
MNYKLTVQYDGTDFHGWQVQNNHRTVQGELERVLTLLEDSEVHVAGSGRTDAGVHAEGQVANVKLAREFKTQKLRAAINGNLRSDVRVIEVEEADDDFHARFSAKGKTYLYRVINSPVISPFWARYAHHDARPLDVAKMNEKSRYFLGEHDWTAFSNAKSDSENKVRTIYDFSVESRWEERSRAAMIEFRISGNGFLRYMVRSIVGTMLEVGRGERDPDTIQAAIVSQDRSLAGITAPANGLTLLEVQY